MRPLEGSEEFCNNPSESGLKTAADLIMWTGPDIPCLDLCSGDTIQKVIYDLAIILCDITDNVLDVSKLNFECLLEDGACPPETLLETLQLIINKHCNLDLTPGSGSVSSLPIVNLPTCLHYKNTDGDTITSLRLDLYAKFLADTICKIIIDIKSLKSVVTNLTTQINTLNATITGGGGSAGGTGTAATVTSKCLSATTPGQTIPVTTAFANLETAMCSYIDLLGTSEQWNTLIDNQCIGANTIIPGTTNEKYSNLAGWVASPNSVVESVSNLWKVVCKLNEKTGSIATSSSSACFPAAPSIIYSTTTQDLSWSSPVPSTYDQPIGYKIKVTNLGTSALVHQNNSISGTALTYDLSPYLTDSTASYKIELQANYAACGDSTAGATIVAPSGTTTGGGGGGTSVTTFKVAMAEMSIGTDLYSESSTTVNSPQVQSNIFVLSGTVTCSCTSATPPCTQKASQNFNYDNNGIGGGIAFKDSKGCYVLENDFIKTGNFDNDNNPDSPFSNFVQFRVKLVDAATENNAINNTGKPIVVKIRAKRSYFKTKFMSTQSPSGFQEYVVNLIIPVNSAFSNYVKVYTTKGTDSNRECRKYNQCDFCYIGSFEGTTEEEGVFPRPASLGTTLSNVGVVSSSFSNSVFTLSTACG